MGCPFEFVVSGAIWLAQSNRGFNPGETRVEPIARPFKHNMFYNFRDINVTFKCIYMNQGRKCKHSFIITAQALDTFYIASSPRHKLETAPNPLIRQVPRSIRVFPGMQSMISLCKPDGATTQFQAKSSVGLLDDIHALL